MILLCHKTGRLPSEILNEDLEWVARLEEFYYQYGRQGVQL